MNLRVALIGLLLGFIGLLLVMGARAFVRWLQRYYPRRASAVLLTLCVTIMGAGWLIALELRDRPEFQPNDLITLQEPVVARIIPADRGSRGIICVVDLHEHLGLLEVEREAGTMKALVESNNTSEPAYCPIGAEVRLELSRLHRMTVTRRQAEDHDR
jgi:hypothetical protein